MKEHPSSTRHAAHCHDELHFSLVLSGSVSETVGGGTHSFDVDDPDLLDLPAAFTARRAPATRGHPPAWLEDVMLELRTSWHSGFTVAEVARRAGLLPDESLTVQLHMPTHTSMTSKRIASSASYYYRTLNTGPRRSVRR